MKTIKISSDEKRNLRNKAKAELERLEKIQTDASTVQVLDGFKNRYNICETVYKVILEKHQASKGKESNSYLKVMMTQVPFALTFAGYDFDKDLLNEIFGAKGKKGTTVKKLRDAVTHGINEKAVNEIISRRIELFGYMNKFLDTIKTFDVAA